MESRELNFGPGNPDKPNVRFSTELKGHAAPIEKVAFNPVKDAELCSVSSDGIVKFWDVRTKACVNEVKDLGATFSLAWAPDGESLVVGNKVRERGSGQTKKARCADSLQDDVIHTLSPTQSTPLASHQQPVQTNHIAFCWGGDKVFAPTGDGRTRILSYPDFEPLLHAPDPDPHGHLPEFALKGHTSSCISAEMSPTGRWLATGGGDSVIAMYDTSTWMCLRTLTNMVGPVKTISEFSHILTS